MGYLTIKEVAERLRVSERTVRRWLLAGKLKGFRFGDRAGWRVDEKDLEAFVARLMERQGKEEQQ